MTTKVMRRLGAVAIVVVGAVHLQQYLGDYHSVPTIGPLFVLNAIGSAVVAVGLLIPFERRLDARRGEIAVGLLAVGAVAIAVGALIGLYIAETGSLFGFSEGSLETPMWIAIVAEVATVLLLGPVAIASLARGSSSSSEPRGARSARPLSSS
jgi:hypothetical protein